MKKLVFLILICISCKKNQSDSKQLVDIIYEIQTSVAGFMEVKYLEYKSYELGTRSTDWDIPAPGTYDKTVKIPKNTLCEIFANHATSNSWKLFIKSAGGTILKETTTIDHFTGPPSYYHARLQMEAQ